MVVFGFHILDPGAGWRMWSGLVYGHAIVCLIFPGAWQLCKGEVVVGYSRSSLAGFFLFFGLLNIMPLWFPLQSEWFYVVVNVVAVAGVLFPLVCGIAVLGIAISKAAGFSVLKGVANEFEN